MMGHREKINFGAEHDIMKAWRSVYCYTQRAGVCKKIKKQMTRRNRRKNKLGLIESVE